MFEWVAKIRRNAWCDWNISMKKTRSYAYTTWHRRAERLESHQAEFWFCIKGTSSCRTMNLGTIVLAKPFIHKNHEQLTRYAKLRVVHAPGRRGTLYLPTTSKETASWRFRHASRTYFTHVPWCMSGSLTPGGVENVPSIPGACLMRNFKYMVRVPWLWYPSVHVSGSIYSYHDIMHNESRGPTWLPCLLLGMI